MAFQITEILDSKSDNVLVNVLHQNHPLTVTILGMERHDISIGNPFRAEIGFEEILDWKIVEDFEDTRSAIWQETDGFHLLGRIHSILDYGDGRTVVDVYMQNGPEFFTVNLDSTDDKMLDANVGLEIIVKTLFLFPSS